MKHILDGVQVSLNKRLNLLIRLSIRKFLVSSTNLSNTSLLTDFSGTLLYTSPISNIPFITTNNRQRLIFTSKEIPLNDLTPYSLIVKCIVKFKQEIVCTSYCRIIVLGL